MSDWKNRIVGHGEQPAEQFLAHPNNPRKHPETQRKAMKGSLDTLGWIAPVIVNKRTGYMIDGHERVWQALKNDNASVPYIEVDLDEAEEAQALATFDFITYMATYDRDMLDALLHDVSTDDENVMATLNELAEYNELYFGDETAPSEDAGAQVDQAEELREKWQTERGQLWVIPSAHGGEHRLLCGDSTDAGDVDRVIAGLVTPLMVTDPPYGVDYDAAWRNGRANAFALNAVKQIGRVANDDNASWLGAWELSPADVAYVWYAYWHTTQVLTDLENAGYEHRAQIIWNKHHFAISRGHYHWKHEPCVYSVRNGKTATWVGDRKQTTVWDIESGNISARSSAREEKTGHSTQKPVECMARPIRNHAGNVYDPFGGSGTTMVACEQLGRQCRMIEIEPKYVAVILERMAGMGLEPHQPKIVRESVKKA